MIWLRSVYDTISNFVNYTTSVGKLEALKGNHAWSDNLFAEWLSKNHFIPQNWDPSSKLSPSEASEGPGPPTVFQREGRFQRWWRAWWAKQKDPQRSTPRPSSHYDSVMVLKNKRVGQEYSLTPDYLGSDKKRVRFGRSKIEKKWGADSPKLRYASHPSPRPSTLW